MKFDLWLFLKGVLMGAADIVPGVSGGTIAFITGIYEDLIESIKGFLPACFALIKHRSLKRFVLEARLAFLVTLLMGIVCAIASLSHAIVFLLTHHPVPLWAFFFGLILASVPIVARDADWRRFSNYLFLLVGVLVALGLSMASPAQVEPSLMVAFGAGMLAICAMILPGISGSFILVLLGAYSFILGALKSLDFTIIAVFAAGCGVGILSIANVLSWAFKHYRQAMLALLSGFMLGALYKVWPWKEVLSYRINSKGEQVPLLERNISPEQFELLNGLDAQLGPVIFCALAAFCLVLGLERWARR